MNSEKFRPGDVLCSLDDLADPGAKGVDSGREPMVPGVIVVLRQGTVFGYENRCPHQGTPLETFPDRFLDPAGDHLVCSTHGARFRVRDGLCVAGPCRGKSLERVGLAVEGGLVARGR